MAVHAAEPDKSAGVISNWLYDFIKAMAQYVLPAVAVLYTTLAAQWNFPHPLEVAASITAIDTFLGVLLGVLKKAYDKSEAKYDGSLVVDSSDPSKDVYSLELNGPIEDAATKGQLIFKVQPPA